MTSKHDWRSRIEFRVANLERLAAIEKEKGGEDALHRQNLATLYEWTNPMVWQSGLDPLAQHKLNTILDQLRGLVNLAYQGKPVPRPGEPV
jgi:hypothetical protein